MEEIMRLLWHLNAELGCLYEVKPMTESRLKEADGVRDALCALAPGADEAGFAAGELEAAAQSLSETETALHELRQKLLAIMPKEGADGK
jgi:hypothetical protein